VLDDDTAWLNAYQQLLGQLPQVAHVQAFNSPTHLFAWLEAGHRADRYILDFDLQTDQTGVQVGQHLLQHYQATPEAIVLSSATLPQVIGQHPFAFCPKSNVAQWLKQWLSSPLDNLPKPHMA
jgi:hypothetical protein